MRKRMKTAAWISCLIAAGMIAGSATLQAAEIKGSIFGSLKPQTEGSVQETERNTEPQPAQLEEEETFHMPTGDMAVRVPSRPMEMLSAQDAQTLDEQMASYQPQEESLLKNKAEHFYYYERLDPVSKQIYDVMLQVARDPVSEGNIGLVMTDIDPQGDEFYYAFNKAYRAICFAHPELFWLYSGEEAEMCYLSEAISQNGFYFVYIKMVEPFTGFEKQMTAFNNAADAFLADIDTSISEYQTIRQIHDKILDLANYNDPVAERLFNFGKGQDLAHTAYGVLVADSDGNPNYAVCDGYTLAFEYLLQQCGIESVFIGGNAGSSPDSLGGHAWSMVKMDGEWYETDCTWDDTGSMLDDLTPGTYNHTYITEALQDTEYREKVDHYLFLVSTETMEHFVPGDDLTYVTQDQMYEYYLKSESYHFRLAPGEDTDEMDPDPDVISLAPVAMMSYGR